MTSLYTNNTVQAPANLTDPTPTYKKHVWLALGGIVLFFIFYLALTFWFFYSGYLLFTDAYYGNGEAFVNIGLGIAVAFLGIFMIKALFFVQTSFESSDRQITAKEEPLLFDYLYKLADETGAPRPHKVYLSNRVNACVFYDLSFLNLFWPSTKNLEIGLGLINVLNLGEFKAVLAHEFGHFAQRSMLVGRWVYIANQIANTIITKRDALDSFLAGLSRIDIRIAWIGWILSIIVWSIRSLVEIIFRIVVLSQRALSREMEFQADLVAVSVTGSDALIHALHKLQAADAAFSAAIGSVDLALKEKKAVEDIYALQTNAIEKTAYILNDEDYGKSPEVPTVDPANFRVFSDKIAQPPKMWATHPPDQEREANAKNIYIPADIDDRSAWSLFADAPLMKIQMTNELIKTAKLETTILPIADSIAQQNLQYQRSYFDPKYRGVYLNRFFCTDFQNPEDIYLEKMNSSEAAETLQKLYPSTLVKELEDYTTLRDEAAQLEAIRYKQLEAGSNGIWHRGTQIRRKELPKVIASVTSEVKIAREKITTHDRLCHTAHLRIAQKIGQGWDHYLMGLMEILHYTEHNINNLNDAHGVLANVLNVVMADGRVSSSEMKQLLVACHNVHFILESIYSQTSKLYLDKNLQAKLKVTEWNEMLEEFNLPPANNENVNKWLQVIDSWVAATRDAFGDLRAEALELLLVSEEKVRQMHTSSAMTLAIAPSKSPEKYDVLLPGEERPIQRTLGAWDRFASAEGFWMSLLKFIVASAIVGTTVFMVAKNLSSGVLGGVELNIYNGLSQNVEVDVDGKKITVYAHNSTSIKVSRYDDFLIQSTSSDGRLIETFKPHFFKRVNSYVYNIAEAAAIVKWTASYGRDDVADNVRYGNQRWISDKADYFFRDPPEQLKTYSSGTSKTIISAFSKESPQSIMSLLDTEEDQNEVLAAHARYDDADSEQILYWLQAVTALPNAQEILEERLAKNPHELITVRALMENRDEALSKKYCEKYAGLSKEDPTNADYFYLQARCIEDEKTEDAAFLTGHKKWPDHGFLAFAAAYAHSRTKDYPSAYQALLTTSQNEPALVDIVSENLERFKRVVTINGKSIPDDYVNPNSFVQYNNLIEAGTKNETTNNSGFAYHHLQNGDLEKAITMVQNDPDYEIPMLNMVAASDGAKEEWVTKALALNPEESLGKNTLFPIVALAAKNNQDLKKYAGILGQYDPQLPGTIDEIIGHLKKRRLKKAEALIGNGDIWTQGQLYSMGCILLGDKAPAEWKRDAKAILFATERPYFE